jgi:hypothetical protein
MAYGDSYWEHFWQHADQLDKVIDAYPSLSHLRQSRSEGDLAPGGAKGEEEGTAQSGSKQKKQGLKKVSNPQNANEDKLTEVQLDYIYSQLTADDKDGSGSIQRNIFIVKNAISVLKAKMETKKVGKQRVSLRDKAKYDALQNTKKQLRKQQKRKRRGYDNPTLAQAMKREDWPEWEKAIKAEYDQLELEEGVFEFLKKGKKPPPGANVLGSMLVLVIKRKPDGSIDKYKARLVALGN